MVASSGTVGESAKDVLTLFGDFLEFLEEEPPKNGDSPNRLLTGREVRELPLLCERCEEPAGTDGLLGTCLIVLIRNPLLRLLSSSYSERAL